MHCAGQAPNHFSVASLCCHRQLDHTSSAMLKTQAHVSVLPAALLCQPSFHSFPHYTASLQVREVGMVPQQAEAYREAVAQLCSNVASNTSSQPGAGRATHRSGAARACALQHDARGCGHAQALRSLCQGQKSECNREQRV